MNNNKIYLCVNIDMNPEQKPPGQKPPEKSPTPFCKPGQKPPGQKPPFKKFLAHFIG